MDTESEYPQQIVDRIPEIWGKYLSIPEDWYPVVTQLDADIAAIKPDYEVHQVKDKFSDLRYYISYEGFTEEERETVNTLIYNAEAAVYNIEKVKLA